MNQNIKAAAEKFWNNRSFDMKNPQLSFITGATWFKMNSGADEMAEALGRLIAEEERTLKIMADVNKKFGMHPPTISKLIVVAKAALAKYNSFIKTEEDGKE